MINVYCFPSQHHTRQLTCHEGYSPQHSTIAQDCIEGQWKLNIAIHLADLCQPYCTHSCQNGGICVAPDECRCTEFFHGEVCQYRSCVRNASVNHGILTNV